MITFYLLSQPDVLSKLNKELDAADARNMSWVQLEKLPYLSAVVNEGLRLSYGITSRSPRIAQQEDLVYRGLGLDGTKVEYVIPRGEAVGSKSILFLFRLMTTHIYLANSKEIFMV